MKLTRFGHACFGLHDHKDRLWLFDPYRPDGLNGRFQLDPVELTPDYIISTHAHEDHAWRERHWRHVPFLESAIQLEGAQLRVFALPHDNCGGARMGFTRAMRLDLLDHPDGVFSVVHAGDVGDVNVRGLDAFCAGVNLLLLPAGGTYTIGPTEAERFAKKSAARDVVLMHFREPGVDLPMLTPEEAFEEMDDCVSKALDGQLMLTNRPPTDRPSIHWLRGTKTRPA